MTAPRWVVIAAMTLESCAGGIEPVSLDPDNDTCRFCRMPVSQPALAAQLVAPGEEPAFFDDIGCLSRFLARQAAPRGAVAFVTDHRTGEWVRADLAVYARVPSIDTPMGSHLVAHRDLASQAADLGAVEHDLMTIHEVFATPPPHGDGP